MNKIMNKNFFKTISDSALARYLKKHVWGDLKPGYLQSDIVEEVLKRLEKENIKISGADYLENLDWAAKSFKAAMKGEPVPCRGCGKKFPLVRLFRCFNCESYFCPECARAHFGERMNRIEMEDT